MKKILIIIGLILLINTANASYSYSYDNNGTGTFQSSWCPGGGETVSYSTSGAGTMYMVWCPIIQQPPTGSSIYFRSETDGSTDITTPTFNYPYENIPCYQSSSFNNSHKIYQYKSSYGKPTPAYVFSVSFNSFTQYTVSGVFNCVDDVSLYLKLKDGGYSECINYSTSSPYSFTIFSNNEYKLIFSDGHEYTFTCNGSDVQYNYDACTYMTIQLFDDCNNLLLAPHTVVYDRDQLELLYDGYDNPIKIDMNETSLNNEIWVSWLTKAGRVDKTVFARSDYPYNLYDQIISWNMNVIVTDNESIPLSGAKVWIYQNCSPCEGSRFGYTNDNGSIIFNCLEGDSFSLDVWKSGYKHYNGTTDFLASAQCLDYSIHILLEPSGSENTTEVPENMTNDTQTNIWFTDPTGNYVNEINDTVEYVDLHYQIYRYNDEDMDLRFQHNIDTLWYTEWAEYLIPNGSTGYYRIYRSGNFSNVGLYRGYLNNDDDSSFDQIAKLRVVNESNESTSHLENLTAWCWIWNTEYDGKIDYHEDIECIIYTNSTNSSLMSITAKFYEDSSLKDTKTLNWVDFINSDPQFFYNWYPDYAYQNGHNYTLKIYGYDNTLLDIDSAYTESIRGLKLTIHVVDNNNNPLDHAYCYVEGWGSLYTDYNSYAIMKGLNASSYHYRAEKGGYRSTGWTTVNMTNDESVTYTLYKDTVEHATRMNKTDIKALFYPFMFILLIVMLMGGLIHVFD